MVRNLWLGAPPPADPSVGCADELTPSSPGVSPFTSENCGKAASRPSLEVNPDDHKAWTDEKHNLYLNQLEVSFVKQLHQLKGLFMNNSEPHQRSINSSQKQPVNLHNASGQISVLRNGCWEKINQKRNFPIFRSSSESCNIRKSPWKYQLKRKVQCRPPSAADNQQVQGKRIISHGLEASSHQLISTNLIKGGLHDFAKEGVGQNFVDEDNTYESNLESPTKRLKTTLTDVTCCDQIVPSTADYSRILTSNPGEECQEFGSGNC